MIGSMRVAPFHPGGACSSLSDTGSDWDKTCPRDDGNDLIFFLTVLTRAGNVRPLFGPFGENYTQRGLRHK
jgi:hypothetical protein